MPLLGHHEGHCTPKSSFWEKAYLCVPFSVCVTGLIEVDTSQFEPGGVLISKVLKGPKIKTFKAFLVSDLILNKCRHLPNALACEQAIILISPSARARLRPREIERPRAARAGERSTRGGRDPDKLPASRLYSNFPPVRETRVRQR